MVYLQKFSANLQGRDFVCGDLHGQLEQLHQAMAACGFDPGVDRLFSVGDLVDRGEHSRETFELLHQPWFFAVRGNHEQMMFNARESRSARDIALWMNNGGSFWVRDGSSLFDEDPSFAAAVAEQQQRLPWSIELMLRDGRRIGLVHAECPCDDWRDIERKLSDSGPEGGMSRYRAVWSRGIRDASIRGPVAHIDLTVHGHTVFAEPSRFFNRCYIDTGACMTRSRLFGLVRRPQGYLSLLQVEDLFALDPLPLPTGRSDGRQS